MTRALIDLADPSRIEDQADILQCVMVGRAATYLSVPITTGRRFVEWFSRRGKNLDPASEAYKKEHHRDVIEPNCQTAQQRLELLRKVDHRIVIEPTALERPAWDQDQYRYFWGKIIERYIERVVFLEGWQYSNGCCYEYLTASRSNVMAFSEMEEVLSQKHALTLIETAIKEMNILGLNVAFMVEVLRELKSDLDRNEMETVLTDEAEVPTITINPRSEVHKDTVLNELARVGNVAQFVSFGFGEVMPQRYCRITGFEPGHRFESASQGLSELLNRSPDQSVNIRSFKPEQLKGEPLVYGIRSVEEAMRIVRDKALDGFYTIVNETVDVKDGGVSGVIMGNLIEFAPDDTPKGVDKPGICTMERAAGLRLLQTVYGFRPALDYDQRFRVEFSLHPRQRGLRHQHTIVWELEEVGATNVEAILTWPNRFSQMLGDKAFGLAVANAMGLSVPFTTVISRRVAPFSFGQQTGILETWMRTCPTVRTPGKFLTTYGWSDPFEAAESAGVSKAAEIASVLAQQAVRAVYSGSLVPNESGEVQIEGVEGKGDRFMLGEVPPLRHMPEGVVEAVRSLNAIVSEKLGPIELEWVFDGQNVWTLQVHQMGSCKGGTLYHANDFHRFDVALGLDSLRSIIQVIRNRGEGIVLVGDVGVTSHFGDLLRQAGIPSVIERPDGIRLRVN